VSSPRTPRPQPVYSAPVLPIALLAAAGFVSGSGMRLLDPLLPMIAGEMSIPVAHAAWIVAGFLLPYGLGQLVIGPLGDRVGKPRVACIACVLYGCAMLVSGAASGLTMLVALRLVSGLFAGAIIPVLMAHIGDSVPYADRQATIGRFLTGQVMAQLVTGPVSGIVASAAGWRASFVLLGALALTVGLAMAWRLGATLWRGGGGGGPRSPGLVAYMRLLSNPAARTLMIAACLDGALLFGGAFPFVGSFLIETFGVSAAHAGAVVAAFGIGAFVYTRFARRMIRTLGERRMLLAGGMTLAAGLGLLSAAPGWHAVVAIQAIVGLAFYTFHGVLQARATEVLPEARGTAVAAFALALFVGQTIGSLIFAAILIASGYRAAFAAAGIGMAILALATVRFPRQRAA
jgi:predicted MFS family arabinose efflux permease